MEQGPPIGRTYTRLDTRIHEALQNGAVYYSLAVQLACKYFFNYGHSRFLPVIVVYFTLEV